MRLIADGPIGDFRVYGDGVYLMHDAPTKTQAIEWTNAYIARNPNCWGGYTFLNVNYRDEPRAVYRLDRDKREAAA